MFVRHLILLILGLSLYCGFAQNAPIDLARFYLPPVQFRNDFGKYKTPLQFDDGRQVTDAVEWKARREEILKTWHRTMGPWPELLAAPKLEYLSRSNRDEYVEEQVRVEIAKGQTVLGYLLSPLETNRPLPAVLIPFYEPETSIGRGKPFLDFGRELARRGFVTLSIGSPGGDAWKPDRAGALCQPLSFLGYIAANCHTILGKIPYVDAKRIGIVGHSYGGKWAMFGSCLYDKFACAVWSDPGIVWDETRPNVNYWEPWYLGLDPAITRKPGVPSPTNPRTGAYKVLVATGHDLHELHALMAPRPFLVSGGSEDPPERWQALNQSVAVNALLGYTNRVAMTNRKNHTPTAESNDQIVAFFEQWLKQ
jgi:dienelactone hydrolase